jgi:hypothetical protein
VRHTLDEYPSSDESKEEAMRIGNKYLGNRYDAMQAALIPASMVATAVGTHFVCEKISDAIDKHRSSDRGLQTLVASGGRFVEHR